MARSLRTCCLLRGAEGSARSDPRSRVSRTAACGCSNLECCRRCRLLAVGLGACSSCCSSRRSLRDTTDFCAMLFDNSSYYYLYEPALKSIPPADRCPIIMPASKPTCRRRHAGSRTVLSAHARGRRVQVARFWSSRRPFLLVRRAAASARDSVRLKLCHVCHR